ncbi:choice-of-anchor D domain-containing protein [Conexibacter sp. JD483]|uniref:choice-of-anchor D domain-containing protein n=1 Tax=unclassified Conexibacter TaxID=2627773 RepID=UPI0027280AA9|nr:MULTISPECIES: choice-of-anchor D domain-containing protein [unclassified Conexibacter]MDO8189078.1 choice-of-anchor D domain-containing protein [Conexibacter sp. CPCC 205706]MDO8201875.1 choice-of-anchor D domain-containing protein [Conexibacter sp. CPCC 205762]MDR9372512.1 choice-of-anchor D domain-containing protein [Conexibacter sp. JD483]
MPLLTLVPAALALNAATASAAPVNRFLTISGCSNQFVVPNGVTRMDVTVVGSAGDGSNGGLAAQVSGTIAVTPGETLYGCVSEGAGDVAGGVIYSGFPGGGYALLSRNSDLSSPFAIAGGGGGAGGNDPNGGSGGDAGLPGGNAGSGQRTGVGGANGGQGANAGGAGAAGTNSTGSSANGRAGTIRRGGAGGYGDVGGGGGGGGVWGGGGGAGSVEVGNGAGGGGGSSYCDMGASCSSQLVRNSGYIQLTYPAPDVVTTTTAQTGSNTQAGKLTSYTATVSPVPSGGTVAFSVDGTPVWGCEAVAVDTTSGVARCDPYAPYAPGAHRLDTTYSGTTGFAGSGDDEAFTVYAGAVSISPSPAFDYGDVELGKQAPQQFTVTNSGDGQLQIDAIDGIYVSEYWLTSMPPRSTEFVATDDLCSDRTLAPGASCTVTVAFKPTTLGEQRAELLVMSDAYDGPDPVALTGVGIEPAPEPRPEPRPEPTPQPQPATPTPATPAPAPAVPTPTPAARNDPRPRVVGASANVSASNPPKVSPSNSVTLPLVCPVGEPCRVSGTLTLALTGGQARASQASTVRVLARFAGIKIAAGKTRSLSLKLPAAFVKAQQKKGVRKLRTTLTVRTTLGSGQSVTRRQAVTIVIPRARVAQRAAPRAAPERPAFTG